MNDMGNGKKAHFIGICGVGMFSVASILKSQGWEVSGSDEGFYPPVSEKLKASTITLHTPYKKENIPEDVDIIIIGKNAKLTPEENEEVAAAFESGVPVGSFPDILKDLTDGTYNVVVAGSYGKSTSTALIAHVLMHAGKDPSYFIGAFPHDLEENARLGDGDMFVLEGDEYPSSNWDSQSKFLHYHATDVLLTAASHDHVNVFPTLESYHEPFKTLLAEIPDHGTLIANIDEEHARNFFETYTGNKVSYGFGKNADYSAENISYGEVTTFDLTHKGKTVITLHTKLLGKHNVENIVGTSALMLERDLVSPEELQKGIATFSGITRRLDRKSEKTVIPIYEGFGSSYQKTRAAIEAMRLHYPNKKLITVFEPHTFTWRNRATLDQYDTAFEGSDMVIVFEPATQGAETHEQLTQEEIVAQVQKTGTETVAIQNQKNGLEIIKNILDKDTLILLLTSGDLDGLIEKIPQLAEEIFPK